MRIAIAISSAGGAFWLTETYDQIFDLLKKGEVDAFASFANDKDDYANWNIPNIPTSLKNRASPGFFYTVNTPADMTSALNAMFNHAVAEARITNGSTGSAPAPKIAARYDLRQTDTDLSSAAASLPPVEIVSDLGAIK